MVWQILAEGFESQSHTSACQEYQNPEAGFGPVAA